MTIGEKIKQLRQQNDVTQEKLAEYLNISAQSVSKWETNNASPDITLLVPLANFFGVTTDELLNRTADGEQSEINAWQERDYELSHRMSKETIFERIEMWREAVQKYPRNFQCLTQLAYALHDSVDRTFDEAVYQANAKEVISICERVLRDCTDDRYRESAIQLLVYTYTLDYTDVADEAMAEKYADMAGSMYTCREILREHAYFTEEGKKKGKSARHHNNLTFMDFLCGNIVFDANKLPPEERVVHYETALKLWETLIYDGNFLFYYNRIIPYAFYLAKAYAELGKRDETLAALRKAVTWSDENDAIPVGERDYTSRFVNAAGSTKPFEEDNTEWNRNFLGDACFDFVRDEADFREIAKKCGET